MTREEIWERALEDVVRILHAGGRTKITMHEWIEMMERRAQQLGWKPNGKKKTA